VARKRRKVVVKKVEKGKRVVLPFT